MEAAGLRREDVATSIEIWPENLRSYEVFNSLGTQWCVGMAGPTGLNYCAVEAVLRLQGLPAEDWPELFNDVRIMEASALDAMRGVRGG